MMASSEEILTISELSQHLRVHPTTIYRLLREEGLLLGSTAGINVAAAVTLAKQMGPGHTIVTVLCDGGAKYQSRLFNKEWVKERGFLEAIG